LICQSLGGQIAKGVCWRAHSLNLRWNGCFQHPFVLTTWDGQLRFFCAYKPMFDAIKQLLSYTPATKFFFGMTLWGRAVLFKYPAEYFGHCCCLCLVFWCLKWSLRKALFRCLDWECPCLIPRLGDCWLKPLICALRNHSVDILTSNGLRDALGP
jgi:hypothetical protein